MNDMTIELHIFEEIDLDVVAVPAQVVPCKINQHNVLGILLGIIAQILRILPVLFRISRTFRSTGDGVYISFLAHNTAMRFRAGTEDAEAAEVEIEQVWTWVDTAQGTIQLEVISFVSLHESARKDNLEYIAAKTVGYAAADVLPMLIVCEGAAAFPHGMEVKRLV